MATPPCSAQPPSSRSLVASGDSLYGPRICSSSGLPGSFHNWTMRSHRFISWTSEFGGITVRPGLPTSLYRRACDTTLPLARTVNAFWLLNFSAEDFDNDNWSGDVLHWARSFVRFQMGRSDGVRPVCGDGTFVALTRRSTSVFSTSWSFELAKIFFYDTDVVGRAGTLLHEARHRSGKSHNAPFPAGSVFLNPNNPMARNGDSTWAFDGAWKYHAAYLSAFYTDGRRTSVALRRSALQRANIIVDNAFATHPGFTFPNILGL